MDSSQETAPQASDSKPQTAPRSNLHSLYGKLGAAVLHSRYSGSYLTKNARRAFELKFLTEVDPNHELAPADRERRAKQARTAHYERMKIASEKAKRAKKERLAAEAGAL